MGRAVFKDASPLALFDIEFQFPRELQNAWFVWLSAGDIAHALQFLPYRLPWVIFQRKNELRTYPMERFESFLYNGSKPMHHTVAE